ncbi:hypothetical protein [Flavobacterium sp. TAB 87]|uniref:hypothetical protein n=1 Tax=Flavobacterium sp. TAB 87 TaxID=1729581 RepID=UPI00076C136D|nr:hypothetical protein [Flavobacterium sp. TAB 87]KVV16145.1 hypothetical protein AP058_00310 [Flavobacterium sp. TAB 87]
MQKQILHNQSLLDIAVQSNGTALSVFEIAIKNGISITTEMVPGQNIELFESPIIDREIVDYFAAKEMIVATGFNGLQEENIIPQLGIGSMAIGSTFIVG